MPKIYSHNNTFLTEERKSGGKRAIGSMAILGNESRAERGSIKKLKRSYICCYASPVESHLQYLHYCASCNSSTMFLYCYTSAAVSLLLYLCRNSSAALPLSHVVIALVLCLCNQFCHRATSIQIIALYSLFGSFINTFTG